MIDVALIVAGAVALWFLVAYLWAGDHDPYSFIGRNRGWLVGLVSLAAVILLFAAGNW